MECPKCKKEIENVNVISECWQKGTVDAEGKVVEYGSVEEVLDTLKIEHRDNDCLADVTDLIKD